MLAGTGGFLFCTHQMHVPSDALMVALLFATVALQTQRITQDVLCDAYVYKLIQDRCARSM